MWPTALTRPADSKAATSALRAAAVSVASGFSMSVGTPAAASSRPGVEVEAGRRGDHGQVEAELDERLDGVDHLGATGDAVPVTGRVGDADQLDALDLAQHPGVVAAHHADADEAGRSVAAIRRPPSRAVLTAVDDALEVALRQRRVHGQREALARRLLRDGQVVVGRERLQPVVGDRVEHARTRRRTPRAGPRRDRRGPRGPGRCTGGRRALRRRPTGGVVTPVEVGGQEGGVLLALLASSRRPWSAAPGRWRRGCRSSGC